MRRERFGFWAGARVGDVGSLRCLVFDSGESDGLGSPGVVVDAMVAGRLRLRLGSKRRARPARGLSNFRLGKCLWGETLVNSESLHRWSKSRRGAL